MGHEHARAWANNAPRGKVVAVTDTSPERATHLAGAYCAENVPTFPDLESMLATAGLDAVDICLPHHLHTEAILAAAQAGKAILCEKPICTTLEDAAIIGDALAESGVTFMAAHNQLFHPESGRGAPAARLRSAGATIRVSLD